MDDTQKTRAFVDLYTMAFKAATRNTYIRSPKEGSEKWKQLEAARKIVDQMGGEYGDYIRIQFAAAHRLGFVPSPKLLCSKKAVDRYMIHQKMKNKYHYSSYSVEGDRFIVHATGMEYPISQADSGLQQDPVASYAHTLAREGTLPANIQTAILALEYAIAKLRYHNKVPTEALMRMLKLCKEA